jgi:hypothetical protein
LEGAGSEEVVLGTASKAAVACAVMGTMGRPCSELAVPVVWMTTTVEGAPGGGAGCEVRNSRQLSRKVLPLQICGISKPGIDCVVELEVEGPPGWFEVGSSVDCVVGVGVGDEEAVLPSNPP